MSALTLIRLCLFPFYCSLKMLSLPPTSFAGVSVVVKWNLKNCECCRWQRAQEPIFQRVFQWRFSGRNAIKPAEGKWNRIIQSFDRCCMNHFSIIIIAPAQLHSQFDNAFNFDKFNCIEKDEIAYIDWESNQHFSLATYFCHRYNISSFASKLLTQTQS